jgi:hypothetical protein
MLPHAEALFQQLAEVFTALVATTFPTSPSSTTTSTSQTSSSATAKTLLKQQAALSVACLQLVAFMPTAIVHMRNVSSQQLLIARQYGLIAAWLFIGHNGLCPHQSDCKPMDKTGCRCHHVMQLHTNHVAASS